MKKLAMLIILVFLMALTALPALADTATYDSCWGMASKAFAISGKMGEHARDATEPGDGREGLGNLAHQYYEANLIPEDSLAALGALIVSLDSELNNIEACE